MAAGLKTTLRAILPWPVLTRCEAFYAARFGEIELDLVKHLCRPDQDAIDVGANAGVYVHRMRRYARRVYAFEPVPWLCPTLAKKFGRGVVVDGVALSSDSGTARLYIPVVHGKTITGLASLTPTHPPGESGYAEITVETRPLDEVYAGDVGFMKIDVEGHEESVLEGARRTIARSRPRVLVEAEERHSPGSIRRVRAFFRALGYRGYFVFRHRLQPIERFDPAEMQNERDIDGFACGQSRRRFDRYVNNFLFLPPHEPSATLHRLETALEKPAPLEAASRLWCRWMSMATPAAGEEDVASPSNAETRRSGDQETSPSA